MVVSEFLAIRLEGVVQKVISAPQFSFLEGQQMVDNILIANELVDDAKRRKKGALFFKVDIEKTYDFVDWKYLDYLMEKMGFNKWRSWIA